MGVQWHAEWRATDDEVSVRLYEAFGAAARGGRFE
jgi:gamma-glutamyl-gamma-aminobutyrate hydrolase PuuD